MIINCMLSTKNFLPVLGFYAKRNMSVIISSLPNKLDYEQQYKLSAQNIIQVGNPPKFNNNIKKTNRNIVQVKPLTPELMALCCGDDCNYCAQKEGNFDEEN